MTTTSHSRTCRTCGCDPDAEPDGKPRISFDGTLEEIQVRKVVKATPPHPSEWIYDAMFGLTGSEPPIPAQMHRRNQSSMEKKLGRTFRIQGATIRFEHGEPPTMAVQDIINQIRGAAFNDDIKVTLELERRRWASLLNYITGLQIQLAQARMVIQVSDVKEAG